MLSTSSMKQLEYRLSHVRTADFGWQSINLTICHPEPPEATYGVPTDRGFAVGGAGRRSIGRVEGPRECRQYQCSERTPSRFPLRTSRLNRDDQIVEKTL